MYFVDRYSAVFNAYMFGLAKVSFALLFTRLHCLESVSLLDAHCRHTAEGYVHTDISFRMPLLVYGSCDLYLNE